MKQTKIYISMFIAIIVFVGCETPSTPTGPENNSMAKRAVYPAYAGEGLDGNFVLWADKTTEAGMVSIDENGVTILTNGFSEIRGVHIYIWSDESEVSTFRPEPGHADYAIENIHESELTIDVPAESYSYITVHVALEQGHRAYMGGDEVPDGFPEVRGNWWGYVGFSPEVNCERWCDCHVC